MNPRVTDRLSLLGYTAGWSAVRYLPDRAAYAAFRSIADAVWARHGPAVLRLEANLSRALGPTDPQIVRETSRAGLRSYLRYWCDTFRLPDWSAERIVERIRVEHEERMREPLAAGRGVVIPLGHMANWDHAGAWACLTGAPVTTVVERVRPEPLFERFVGFRERLGMEILPLTGGDGTLFGTLAQRLRQCRLVPLLADRDLSRTGIDVTLFGGRTRLPSGPAALALRTGAALVPATVWYEGREPDHRVVIAFHEEIAVPAGVPGSSKVAVMTQLIADELGRGISAHAQDWHMMQPMFLTDPPGGACGESAAPSEARR